MGRPHLRDGSWVADDVFSATKVLEDVENYITVTISYRMSGIQYAVRHSVPTLLIERSLVTAQRSLSLPVALSKAFTRDACPSSVLCTDQIPILRHNVICGNVPFHIMTVLLESHFDCRP